MDPSQSAMYGLVKTLFDMLYSSNLSMVAIPVVTIMLLLRFILWARGTARGDTAESLVNDYESARQGRRDPRAYKAKNRRGRP